MLWLVVLGGFLLLLWGGSFGLSRIEQRQAERRHLLDEMMMLAQATTALPLAQLQAMLARSAQYGWSPSQKDEGMR